MKSVKILRVQKVMSRRSAGACTRCTRSNAFPVQKSFVAPNYCYTIKYIKIKTELQTVLSLGSVRRKRAKNDLVHEAGKGRSSKCHSYQIFFLFIYCDVKTLSFQFCNDICIGFEIPG